MKNNPIPRILNVLIFKTEDKKYFAMPLGLNTCSDEPTLQEALETITKLIDSHILTGLELKIPLDKLFSGVGGSEEPKFYEIFKYSNPYDYEAVLSPEVQRIVSRIDYRVSDQIIDNDTFARYLKGEM